MGVTLVAVAGGGYLYIQELNSNIRTGNLHADPKATVAAVVPNQQGQTPLNILLIGSDGRSTAADCKLGGSCDNSPPHADVEMLVHLSADRSNASITSIPRDTVVDLADCQGHNNRHEAITDSLNYGGPACVVDTWQKLTGISIDHYMMIDFSGVVNMADAIGGVQVCTKQNVMDYQVSYDASGVRHEIGSHLLYPAGTRKIQGEQALEWLRTRHAWEDGSDIGRTHAQHLYINSMIRQMKSLGTLTNVSEMNNLAQAATKALQVDDKLGTVTALSSLALEFNKVPTNRITTVTIPWQYGTNPSNPLNLPVELKPEAQQIFAQLRNDIPFDKHGSTTTGSPTTGSPTPSAPASAAASPTPVDKAAVQVSVQNASGVNGRGKALTEFLVAKGFTHATLDFKNPPAAPTRLTYPAADQAQAQAVAAAFGLSPAALTASSSATHLTLVIGTDWTTGTAFTSAPAKSAGLPPQTDSQNAADDSTQCMVVNQQKSANGNYLYSWTGSTPPVVPQP
ncbi:LCP family protein [Streptacidiphilus sp. MAP12-16]|uniref:LCP family protein n=1 Tax=Streptacidiphilus sp. MAP12-16 TaxID=3156300 RepID=UPI003513CBFE